MEELERELRGSTSRLSHPLPAPAPPAPVQPLPPPPVLPLSYPPPTYFNQLSNTTRPYQHFNQWTNAPLPLPYFPASYAAPLPFQAPATIPRWTRLIPPPPPPQFSIPAPRQPPRPPLSMPTLMHQMNYVPFRPNIAPTTAKMNDPKRSTMSSSPVPGTSSRVQVRPAFTCFHSLLKSAADCFFLLISIRMRLQPHLLLKIPNLPLSV